MTPDVSRLELDLGAGGRELRRRRPLPWLAQLFPSEPSPYAAALLYAVALDACGEAENALSVLREAAVQFGLRDEQRVMAARIHLAAGRPEIAHQALTHSERTQQDALEYT